MFFSNVSRRLFRILFLFFYCITTFKLCLSKSLKTYNESFSFDNYNYSNYIFYLAYEYFLFNMAY